MSTNETETIQGTPGPKKIGVPKEIFPGECRVAATPETAARLQKLGFDILIESGAGAAANCTDDAYKAAGCTVVSDAASLWSQAEIILKVRAPQESEIGHLNEGKTLISFLYPAQNEELVKKLAATKATVIAMDMIPRISRAQKMDALSSMANVAGYRAVVEAANNFGRFFTGQITAAGKVPPAKVLVIGAGVAGLASIGAANSLGAIVRAFDTRPVVKEQIESLGAEFLMLDFKEDGTGEGGYAKVMSKEFIEAEMALFAEQAKDVDIIITTALIPGKRAPILITSDMVKSMKEGSVIVDLAAEQGGNCEDTKPGECVKVNGVTVVGYTDLPSRMANQSSQLYGTNLWHLLSDMGGHEKYRVDHNDEVVRGALIIEKGAILPPPPKPEPSPAPPAKAAEPVAAHEKREEKKKGFGIGNILTLVVGALALYGIGTGTDLEFIQHFTVFVLAVIIGFQVVWNVTPSLHTPLMSVTNAISGIIIVGGMLQISGEPTSATTILGAVAILIGTINIAGGFLVTQRMLAMFRK